jgi:hypothetical protein
MRALMLRYCILDYFLYCWYYFALEVWKEYMGRTVELSRRSVARTLLLFSKERDTRNRSALVIYSMSILLWLHLANLIAR